MSPLSADCYRVKSDPLAWIIVLLDTHLTQDGQLVELSDGNNVWSDTLGSVYSEIQADRSLIKCMRFF